MASSIWNVAFIFSSFCSHVPVIVSVSPSPLIVNLATLFFANCKIRVACSSPILMLPWYIPIIDLTSCSILRVALAPSSLVLNVTEPIRLLLLVLASYPILTGILPAGMSFNCFSDGLTDNQSDTFSVCQSAFDETLISKYPFSADTVLYVMSRAISG